MELSCYNTDMKLIAQVKLQPTKDQSASLRKTLLAANGAAQLVSDHAWMTKTFGQFDLHHALYYDIREKFKLSSQMTVRVVAKVADSYKHASHPEGTRPSRGLDKKSKRTFAKLGSVAYDSRILTWKDNQVVSLWSLDGRLKIPYLAGQRQLDLLQHAQGEADLVHRKGEWYLLQTCDIPEPEGFDPDQWLGVDSGLVNIAVDSDGNFHDGAAMLSMRKRRRRQRARLQAKQTKSAKRVLRHLSQKEQRYASNENHRISKEIVELAKCTGRGIAVEDLTGIRDRVKLRRKQRTDLHSWSFHQLHSFLEYKAKLHGVSFKKIDPRNTSRTCSCCGYIDQSNRKSQDTFLCGRCGFAAHADHNAAINISVVGRGIVNRPDESVTDVDFYQLSGSSPSVSTLGI